MLGAAAIASLSGGPAAASDDRAVGLDAVARQAANLEVIRRYAKAWTAGDLKAIVACYHPDFTLHYFGRSALAGDHVGLANSLAKLAEFSRRTNRRLVGIVDAFSGPERAAIVAHERFTRGTLEQDVERLLVYSIKDGRLHHCWVYDADPELVDRFLA
jgi:hypothetical protein